MEETAAGHIPSHPNLVAQFKLIVLDWKSARSRFAHLINDQTPPNCKNHNYTTADAYLTLSKYLTSNIWFTFWVLNRLLAWNLFIWKRNIITMKKLSKYLATNNWFRRLFERWPPVFLQKSCRMLDPIYLSDGYLTLSRYLTRILNLSRWVKLVLHYLT